MENISWEQTKNGFSSKLSNQLLRKKPSEGLLISTALLKMTDVTLISGEFSGTNILFENWISLLIETKEEANFYGVYQKAFQPSFYKNKDLPSICLRHIHWNRKDDLINFRNTYDKKSYILSDEQLKTDIIFLDYTYRQKMKHLVNILNNIFQNGISFKHHLNSGGKNISLDIADNEFIFNVNYLSNPSEKTKLDIWIDQWISLFESLLSLEGILPQKNCSLSYRESLIERLNAFSGNFSAEI
ncbi:MAG: hypothetical protein HXX18_15265 [Bacteroidetes bacterium]|nr:hypothetical protein [Bacteroidota bacterium]